MPKSIFDQRYAVFTGTLSADSARAISPMIQESMGANLALLMLNLQITYEMKLTRLYELGTEGVYLVGGAIMGNARVGRLIAPRSLAQPFIALFTMQKPAPANSMVLDCQTKNAKADLLVLSGAQITHLAVSLPLQDLMINDALQVMFTSLVID